MIIKSKNQKRWSITSSLRIAKDCTHTERGTKCPKFYMANVFFFHERLLSQRAIFPRNPEGALVLLSSETKEKQVWSPGYLAVVSMTIGVGEDSGHPSDFYKGYV